MPNSLPSLPTPQLAAGLRLLEIVHVDGEVGKCGLKAYLATQAEQF